MTLWLKEPELKLKNMKKIFILTCCLVAFFLGHALAQTSPISKSLFTDRVNALKAIFASQKNNTTEQSNRFNGLLEMMNNQISYLNSTITSLQAQYKADTTKTGPDKRNADANYKKVAATFSKNGAANNAANLAELQKVAAAAVKAHNEDLQWLALYNTIQLDSSNLKQEKTFYNILVPLKGSNLFDHQVRVIDYLNGFASTLQ